MGEQEIRQTVERMFELSQKGDAEGIIEHYADDVVIEFPQSGEQIEGSKNALEVLRNYPEGTPSFTPRRIRVAGDLAVAEHQGQYPDGSIWFVVTIREFEDGRVVHEADYFSQGFEAPEWRSDWVTQLERT